jgi:hypothetical protein
MVLDLTAIFLLLAGTPAIFLIMFLPAFLELRRPRDRGPRRIQAANNKGFSTFSNIEMSNLEEEFRCDGALILLLERVMTVLPSLDS